MLVFIEICTFDLYPTDEIFFWMFEFPDYGAYTINFQTTGYESIFVLVNLGLVFFIIGIYLLITMFHLIHKAVIPCSHNKTC